MIDEQLNYQVVHNLRVGKTNSPTGKSLDSGSESKMLTLNTSASSVSPLHAFVLVNAFGVAPHPSVQNLLIPKGSVQLLELKERFIITPAKYIGIDLTSSAVNCVS